MSTSFYLSPALLTLCGLTLVAQLTATAHADAAGNPSSIGRALCAERDGCKVHAERAAGRNARGENLRVVALKLPFREGEDCDQQNACNCEPYEYWRVVGASTQRAQKILEFCSDDAGTAAQQARNIEVGANRLTYHRMGGATLAWDRSVLVQLDPPRLVHEGLASWSNYAPHNAEDAQWSWRTFSGLNKWTIPLCTESGEAPEGERVRVRSFAYVPIPRVSVPVAFSWEGWRVFSIEACSARASADQTSGYVTRGTPGSPDDTSVYALATPRALFVEVRDDQITPSDELTVWLVEPPAAYSDPCYAEPPAARHWTIRLSDGAVLSRAPGLVGVEVVQLAGRARVKLSTRISEHVGLAVSYVDSDGDGTPERSIATSDLTRTDVGAVGRQFEVGSDRARCILRQGALMPRMMTPEDSATALITDD